MSWKGGLFNDAVTMTVCVGIGGRSLVPPPLVEQNAGGGGMRFIDMNE